MEPQPSTPPGDEGPRRRRPTVAALVALLAVAVVAIALVIEWGDEQGEDSGPAAASTEPRTPSGSPAADSASPTREAPQSATKDATEGAAALPFEGFPLAQGWAEVYGENRIDQPSSSLGGVFMPEGHCDEGLLYESGHQDRLATRVSGVSRTRELLGYPDARAARATFEALRDAVASCADFYDSYTDTVVYSASVYDGIDEGNARGGETTTFTFAYTSSPSGFGVVYQFALAGHVLYGSSIYGDWTSETVGEGVAALDEENDPLVPLLARFER